ncbi:unnamed protein product [Prorocentrum cordatum]|uniref:Uncharacterized protein n=1 Tax=Prorocentrum cordatum TaxID=2364126 RepID=A0ABN9YLB2_9DINO|nr:unnamed protein product [Polarella glacialis]
MCAGNLRVLRMLLPGSQNIRAHAGARSLSGKADLQCYLLFSVALLVRKALFRNAVNATLLTSQIERLWEHHAQALRPPGFPDVHIYGRHAVLIHLATAICGVTCSCLTHSNSNLLPPTTGLSFASIHRRSPEQTPSQSLLAASGLRYTYHSETGVKTQRIKHAFERQLTRGAQTMTLS